MQESNGEIFNTMQAPEIMQIKATAIISWLFELLFLTRKPSKKPEINPTNINPILYRIGSMMLNTSIPSPLVPVTIAVTTLNTNKHTTSSRATTCNKVLTNSPLALY